MTSVNCAASECAHWKDGYCEKTRIHLVSFPQNLNVVCNDRTIETSDKRSKEETT